MRQSLTFLIPFALLTAGGVVSAEPGHWAYRPVVRREPPPVAADEWPLGPIDRFVLSELEDRGIAPSPEARRATLIRRLWLDLTGLPPSPRAVDRFLTDPRPDAFEREVDRVLASPSFGEREARRWLDLARYADSDGYEKDGVRPWAWRWRDWVIRSFNEDLPYDRFTIEQLAGDLLDDGGPGARIATGFHRNTLHNAEGGVDPEEDRVKKTIDRTNTTALVWLGLTAGCAECHDHKYDDWSQREYFELYAFFDNLEERDAAIPFGGTGTGGDRTKEGAEPKAQTLAERDPPRATRIHIRGDFLRPGDAVGPGTPAILPPLRARGSRPDRLDLARWLVSSENPLTARVAVNRIWSALFGRGLVATEEDFGVRGDRPSHPELLDWLASEFVRLGWSRKRLIREIVTSRVYRQSSCPRPDLAEIDPENRLLARQGRFRVAAETVRDLALSASGLLALEIGGPSVRPPLPEGVADLGYAGSVRWPESQGADRWRRGLYIFLQRTVPYPMLATFDAPDGTVSCIRRERSNTPLQALTLLDDPVFVECARAFARRVLDLDASSIDDRSRIAQAFRLATGRRPDPSEVERLAALLRDLRVSYAESPDEARALIGESRRSADGEDRDVFEQAAWIALARALLNLDEHLTRE